MDYFQARISIETSEYFRLLKEKYEDETKTNLTQAIVIARALDDVAAISNWEKVIHDNSIKLRFIEKEELESKELRLRVQLSDQLKNTIYNYKLLLPDHTKTRSVSIGVTLKYIFKGALLLQSNPEIAQDQLDIDSKFEKYEKILLEYVAPANEDKFKSLLQDLKVELKKL
ncbi:hypothetical protein ROU88_08185 [Macrococcus capreoli]